MPDNSSYKIKSHYQFLVKLVIWVFKKVFKISANITNEVRLINEPYLLLANHYGRYDPFIISDFIKRKPNFVSSDAILRSPLYGPLFTGLGAIPKKKGMRDTHVIREMKKVIDRGGSIALFPEATRTWSGATHYIDPSIAKLVKLLKVPVVTAKMKGAYAFDPRWARPLRRAKVEIDYDIAINKNQIAELNANHIMEIISSKLEHDDIAYARKEHIIIRSNNRAEYIERILFQCPDCENFEGFTSAKNCFSCNSCNYTIEIERNGFFTSQGKLRFDNPRDWLNWQNKNFVNYIFNQLEKDLSTPFFQADTMEICEAEGNGKMIKLGVGTVSFFADRIEITGKNCNRILSHSHISSLSPQFKERIELYHLDQAYRLTSTKHQEPGIKWELAINAVWHKTNEQFKRSPYFKNLFDMG